MIHCYCRYKMAIVAALGRITVTIQSMVKCFGDEEVTVASTKKVCLHHIPQAECHHWQK